MVSMGVAVVVVVGVVSVVSVVINVGLVHHIIVVICRNLLVVRQFVGERRKSWCAWAVMCRPGPLVVDWLRQVANDWLALVRDGL